MRDGWDDSRTVDDALGMPDWHVCGAYRNLSNFGQVDDGDVASWWTVLEIRTLAVQVIQRRTPRIKGVDKVASSISIRAIPDLKL
ncbi:hypothetical protein Syun_009145 [Stephania yunnanensis]|uniref:Uncharacterized protein n=1 Tax=Stephania yunnanensis TaxID=152371 RepID=A0AAP0PS09_9MAGN